MNEYVFSADLLNKFSQLTPWVQGLLGLSFCAMIVGISYFIKSSVTEIMKPFVKHKDDMANVSGQNEEKKEWKDKYYRG